MSFSIAIDARPLTPPITGIGRYLQHALIHLIPENLDIHWYLYSVNEVDFNCNSSNFTLVHHKLSDFCSFIRTSSIYNTLCTQVLFPIWCRRDGIQIYWSPRHHIPLLIPSSIKKIVTIHDLLWFKYPQYMPKTRYMLEKSLMPRSLKAADKIICVSESTLNDLRCFSKTMSNKAILIYSNSPTNSDINHENNIISFPFILFVGTLEPRKNLRRLLVAYSEMIKNEILDDQLVIAGKDGWGRQNISSLVNALGISSKVIITGYISDHLLHSLYKQAALVILPSLHEGFGLTALEAMRYGIPVISSNTASLPELVGREGAIIDPFSITSIENALSKFYHDKSFRKALKKSALNATKKFDSKNVAVQLSRVLRSHLPET